jgi:predicted phosphodiesterase
MKKVLVIGDTHGNIKKMLKIIKQEHADYVIHAGDYDDVNINDKNHPYHKLNRNILKKYFSY